MVEIKWTPHCLDDIKNIAEFIAKDSLKYSFIQVGDFFESVIILEKFPKIGRIVPEVGNKNIRELIVGFYRLIYRIVDADRVDIVTVHHSNRLLESKIIKNRIKAIRK